jgi:hypothetical protein
MRTIEKGAWLLTIASLAACSTEQKPEAAAEAAPKPINLPYEVAYSSSFEMGNPEYATMVVQGSWKDWENNELDNMKNWVADTIVAFHSDNVVTRGADNLIARWKAERALLTSVKPTIDAAMSVYSTDKKENWVLIWAQEIDTRADGTVDTTALMETWRINAATGKADFLLQYNRANRKK